MKKWTSLNASDETSRWKLLSEHLTRAGAENEFVPWTEPMEEFKDLNAFSSFYHVRLSSSVAPKLLRHIHARSSWITLLGVTDGMVQTPHGWWPLCALYEGLGQFIIKHGTNLDNRGNVLVAGAGGRARASIAAFFKGGFSKFLLTNYDEKEALALVADLRVKFLGIEIEWIPTPRIVLLPADSSVLINCTPSIEENTLIRELSYLNFLRRPGFLFDLNRDAKKGILVEEATQAEVKVITGQEIGARTDVLWAKWAFQVDLNLDAYEKDYLALLNTTNVQLQ